MENTTDIFVIGGGINGAAIAADAAGRGLKVTLCEMNDLGSGASSTSTKLIHGGLRYLELYEFDLVRKALLEREVLMRRAPYIIKPLEFVLPYQKQFRPAWLIRLGLFIYDHLAKRKLIPGSKSIRFDNDPRGIPLKDTLQKGFSYYDCISDDSRLVILNALSAQEHGASILTHTQFVSAAREKNMWKIQVMDLSSREEKIYFAKALVNTAGRWINEVNKTINGRQINFGFKLVKGSHIVIPKLYVGDFAYLLECADKRVVFTIPYQQEFTLIGTTDVAFENNNNLPTITADEQNYLITLVNSYFKKSISTADIMWSYAGVRCLQDNTNEQEKLSEISRDYKLLLETDTLPVLLTVIGGKLTTHRTLAEDALKKLKPFFPAMGSPWTANSPLPGWDFSGSDFSTFLNEFKTATPWLSPELALRYATTYGDRAYQLLKNVKSKNALGQHYGAGLYQIEIDYLIQHEWAKTADDILWRRTKLGLHFSKEDQSNLAHSL